MIQRAILKLYRPTPAQLQCHQSPHKFNVICFGRQSGKSTYANNKMFQRAWKQENGIYWYIGPTYRLAEQMHDRALFSLKQSGAVRDSSLSDLMVELKSCARIFYKSGDNPGALLGETLHGAVMDECREQDRATWSRVIMPMLGTTGGWCDFLSTPNGFDWFYDLYQNHLTKPNWGAFHAPSTSNPLWTPEMIQEARESMSEDEFAQEIMAEFRDIGAGTCYVSFGQHNIKADSPFVARGIEYSPNLPIIVGMDFNITPMCWILGQHYRGDFYWHDEIYQLRADKHMGATESAAVELAKRVQGHKPGVILIGDASGKAGQRAAQAGQSDYDVVKNVLRQHGIVFQDRTPDSNPPIKDRVNTVNSRLKSADGSIHVWYNPKCKIAIKDRRRRLWKGGGSSLAFDNSDPLVGHMSDAGDYPICVLSPIKQIGSVGRVRVIHRSV